ncbi:MAG: T9SS type A sorting domain-containing protein [Bacteroidota bacterium]
MKLPFLIFLLFFSLFSLSAQDFGQRFKALPLDREPFDFLGASVSLQGDEFLSGAPGEDHNVLGANFRLNAGSVYAFQRDGQGGWQQTQKLVTSDRSALSQFGYSVMMDGNHALIGAPFEALGLSGDSAVEDAGAVYAFQKDSNGVWQETQKLVASDRATFDWFGEEVVMEGNIALISAKGRDNTSPGGVQNQQTGAVYAFERDSMGFWQETQILAITDTGTFEQFGTSISLDGDLVLIGAPGETEDENGQNTQYLAGAAYLWQRQITGQWTLHQKLVSHIRQNDAILFGTSVAMDDSAIVVFQVEDHYDGLFFQYFRPNASGFWEYETSLSTIFHIDNQIRLLMQDSILLIGDQQWNQKRGRVRRHRMNPQGEWINQGYMYPTDAKKTDEFGSGIAVDDTVILIGSSRKYDINPAYQAAGAVYVFETCTPDFPEQQTSICTGDSLWFEGAYVSEAGSYEAAYLNEEGCDSVITLFLEVHPPVETGVNQTDSQLTALANQATFQWLQCDSMGFAPVAGETEAIFSPQQSGEYAVAITSLEGCSDTSSCFSFGPPVSIEPNWATSLQLFPNPTSDQVQLILPQPQTLFIQVSDLNGRIVIQQELEKEIQATIGLPDSPGVYVMEIRDQEGYRMIRKIIRQ